LKKKQKAIALRHAIEQGINSGQSGNFDPEKHLRELKASRK
jgi:hypothetical protein